MSSLRATKMSAAISGCLTRLPRRFAPRNDVDYDLVKNAT